MAYKILLVEDSPTILEVLTSTFEYKGFIIKTANNKDLVYESIKNEFFDVFLLEIDLTDVELIKKIKHSDKNIKSNIFVISANSDVQTKIEFKNEGVNGWIKKPFIPEKLVAEIISFLK